MLWTSTEELLVSYNDAAFVSETYRNTAVGQPSQQRPTSGTCKEIALPCLPNPR